MPLSDDPETRRRQIAAIKMSDRHKRRLARALGVSAQDLVNLQRFKYSSNPTDVFVGLDERTIFRRTGIKAGHLYGVTTREQSQKAVKDLKTFVRGGAGAVNKEQQQRKREGLTVWVRRGIVQEPDEVIMDPWTHEKKGIRKGLKIGHGKGRGPKIGISHRDPRFTARHEIGHTLWFYLPEEKRKELTGRLRHRRYPYEPYSKKAEERFANLYARTRGGAKRRRRGSPYEREILAEALVSMRKKRRARAASGN